MILGFMAESELKNLRFRTREGLLKAKEKGVKLGAKRISKKKEGRIIEQHLEGVASIRIIAKTERISTSIIYKVLERNKIANNRKKFRKFLAKNQTKCYNEGVNMFRLTTVKRYT